MLDLVLDNDSVGGRLATSAAVAVVALVASAGLARLVTRRVGDPFTRYHVRKAVRFGVAAAALVALAVVWQPFAGRIGIVLGLAAAGIAFAMQEVVGAVAGWFNILSGRIFRVGDRIEMGGVQGDVIDITPLRTKILEMGSAHGGDSWVRGRQHTGRIVAVSNKATFTQPVFNFSAGFEYVWEELALPIAYDGDWRTAEAILVEEAKRASRTEGAPAALEQMKRRYPVPPTELEPRVFVRATDDWIELSARFLVPLRTARTVKSALTRRVVERLEEAGIDVASQTAEIKLRDDART